MLTGQILATSVFLHSGSVACWISKGLCRLLKLKKYRTAQPTKLTGIGEGRHSITHNAIVHLFFCTTPGCHISPSTDPGISGRVSVACGILPDNVFPADLTLGRESQTATRTVYNSDKSVTFLSFGHPITLAPLSFHRDPHLLAQSRFMHTNSYLLGLDDGETTANYSPVYSCTANPHPLVQRFRRDYPHVFDPSGKTIARSHLISHYIYTGSAAPIRLPPRCYSIPQQVALKEFVESGLRSGTISPYNSPWSSLALVVPKPDGRYRLCVDLRALNHVTRKNEFPLPNIEDQIPHAAGHELYTTLDRRDGFWQILMALDSIEKTAFPTLDGYYEFQVMPFGLTNAPATF